VGEKLANVKLHFLTFSKMVVPNRPPLCFSAVYEPNWTQQLPNERDYCPIKWLGIFLESVNWFRRYDQNKFFWPILAYKSCFSESTEPNWMQ